MAKWKWQIDPAAVTEETHGENWEYFQFEAEKAQKKLEAGFHIPAQNLDLLQYQLTKLARRFKRVGKVSDIALEVIDSYSYAPNKDKPWELSTVHVCKVKGSVPQFEGWDFQAKLEHQGEIGNFIKAKPGVMIDEKWRFASPYCDHCKTKRRRAETFILTHEDGSTVQVGRSCIKDFLNGADPRDMADAATWLQELAGMAEDAEADGFSSRGPEKRYDLNAFIAAVVAEVEANGYKKDGHTTQEALKHLAKEPPSKWYEPQEITDEHVHKAAAALGWLRGELPNNNSDYFHNLGLVLQLADQTGGVAAKQLNLAASIIVTYNRAMEKAIVQQVEEKTAGKPAEYVGTVGKREQFTLTLVSIISVDTDYGTLYIERFLDPDGNPVVWKTGTGSYYLGQPTEEGHTYTVKATVKAHDVYRGEIQTLIQRVTCLADVTPGVEEEDAKRRAVMRAGEVIGHMFGINTDN